MSWGFSFIADDPEKVVVALDKLRTSSYSRPPDEIIDTTIATVRAFKLNPGTFMKVDGYGHVNPDGTGNMKLEINPLGGVLP